MNKYSVLFLVTSIVLVFQYYYAYNYRETFPAVMMPRFSNGIFQKDVYTFKIFSLKAIYNDNSIKEFTEHDLLNDITKPQRVGAVRNVLANSKIKIDLNKDLEFKKWLKKKTEIKNKQVEKIYLQFKKMYFTEDVNELPTEKLVYEKEIVYENQ